MYSTNKPFLQSFVQLGAESSVVSEEESNEERYMALWDEYEDM
jgi:hypothetical protein